MINIQERIPLVIQDGSLNADRVQQAFKDIWTELAKLKGIQTLTYAGAFNRDFTAKPGCIYLVDPTSGQVNVNFPNTADCYLDRIVIVNNTASVNVIQLRAYPNTTFDGATTYDMNVAWGTVELTSLGSSPHWCLQ